MCVPFIRSYLHVEPWVAYPLDFRLAHDLEEMLDRRGASLPVPLWPNLWHRLRTRHLRMPHYRRPPRILGTTVPTTRLQSHPGRIVGEVLWRLIRTASPVQRIIIYVFSTKVSIRLHSVYGRTTYSLSMIIHYPNRVERSQQAFVVDLIDLSKFRRELST